MIPQTLGAVAGFLGLIAPGLVFELVRGRKRPTPQDTAFWEVSRIALASLCFTSAGLLLLAIVRVITPNLVLDPGAWLRMGKPYVQEHYRAIAGTLSAQILVSCILALGTALWLGRRSRADIRETPNWFTFFRDERPDDTDTFVMVVLNTGDRLFGWVESYTTERLPTDREVVLAGPLQYQAAAQAEPVDLGAHWSFLTVLARSIDYIAIAYLDTKMENQSGIPQVELDRTD